MKNPYVQTPLKLFLWKKSFFFKIIEQMTSRISPLETNVFHDFLVVHCYYLLSCCWEYKRADNRNTKMNPVWDCFVTKRDILVTDCKAAICVAKSTLRGTHLENIKTCLFFCNKSVASGLYNSSISGIFSRNWPRLDILAYPLHPLFSNWF